MTHRYHKPKRLLDVFCLFLLGLLLCWPVSEGLSADRAKVVDRVLAIVNDEIITLSDLNRLYKPYLNDIKKRGYRLEKQREMLFKAHEEFLEEVIRQKLTDQAIEKARVTVSEKQIDDEIRRVKSAYGYSDAGLAEALRNEGLTLDDYRKGLGERLLRENLINLEVVSKIVITPADILAYYESHPELYAGKLKYHLRNIIMQVAPGDEEELRQGIRQNMEQVLKRLQDGESFADQAEIYSESRFASQGGDLGSFDADQLSPQIREALKDLKPGEHSAVLDTEQGYQIFFVENIEKAEAVSLSEATPEIQEKIYKAIVDRKFKEWLDNLHSQSHIKIMQ